MGCSRCLVVSISMQIFSLASIYSTGLVSCPLLGTKCKWSFNSALRLVWISKLISLLSLCYRPFSKKYPYTFLLTIHLHWIVSFYSNRYNLHHPANIFLDTQSILWGFWYSVSIPWVINRGLKVVKGFFFV